MGRRGTEIRDDALVAALENKQTITKPDLGELEFSQQKVAEVTTSSSFLSHNYYIKVGSDYFRPSLQGPAVGSWIQVGDKYFKAVECTNFDNPSPIDLTTPEQKAQYARDNCIYPPPPEF